MFGAGFYEGVSEAREQNRNRRAKVFQAFQQWKQDNPYATAADFQNAVRAIGGGDLSIAGTLPGNQAIQRMAADNARKKQEAEKQQQFERLQKQLSMETTKLNLARAAVETYGDKADANQLAKQFGIPAEVFAPAIEQARSENEARRAKETQANNVKALEYYMGAANAALEAGRTPQEAHDAGLAASGRFASAAGFDLDLGAVGKPSGFQSGTSNHLADMQVTYDAKIQARSNAISEDIAKRIASNPAFLDQAVADPSGAISAAALGIYDESDPAFAAALSDMEARVGVLADQRKQEQDKADRDSASAAYATLSETTGQDLVLGREDDTRTAIINNLIGQGLTEERATAAADEVLSSNQPMLETAFDTQYNDPAALLQVTQASAARTADNFLSPRIDTKNHLILEPIDGVGPSHFVGATGIEQITQIMQDTVFYDETERNLFFRALTQTAAAKMRGGDRSAYASKDELLSATLEGPAKDMKPLMVNDVAMDEGLLRQQQDNFSSLEEMFNADLSVAETEDASVLVEVTEQQGKREVEVDITNEAIEQVVADSSLLHADRVIALNRMSQAIDEQIALATEYLADVTEGRFGPALNGELPPTHRLARGVEYDRASHMAFVQSRIDELKRRKGVVEKGRSARLYNPNKEVSPPKPFAGVIRVSEFQSGPDRTNTGKHRDVQLSELMNMDNAEGQKALNLFSDSMEATFTANPAMAEVLPTLHKALVQDPAKNPTITKAIAQGLEAFDFFLANTPAAPILGPNQRQTRTVAGRIATNKFNDVSAELGFEPVEVYTSKARQEHAMKYAEQYFLYQIDGLGEGEKAALASEFLTLLGALENAPARDYYGYKTDNSGSQGIREGVMLPRYRDVRYNTVKHNLGLLGQ